jgi:hypothetical protein
MRYCMRCGTEYEDVVEHCRECPDQRELVPADEPRAAQRGRLLVRTRGLDTSTFVRAGTADDPLTAEDLTRLLDAACIPVFAREGRGGTVDVLTTGLRTDWWELLVPQEHQARAAQLILEEKARLEATAEVAARAAEEEERETERQPPPPGAGLIA